MGKIGAQHRCCSVRLLRLFVGLGFLCLKSLNLLKASDFNYERLDILRDYIGHPSQKLMSFDFS